MFVASQRRIWHLFRAVIPAPKSSPDALGPDQRDAQGRFVKGMRGGPGKPPGLTTLAQRTLRQMIEAALDRAGGIKWLERLAEEHPPVFAALLSKLLPTPKPDEAPRDLVQIRAFVSAALASHSVELQASEPPAQHAETPAALPAERNASELASSRVLEPEIVE